MIEMPRISVIEMPRISGFQMISEKTITVDIRYRNHMNYTNFKKYHGKQGCLGVLRITDISRKRFFAGLIQQIVTYLPD